jgi:competence protein ComEC
VAAQAAAAPLLAWHFGRIPALGGVANLVVAPLAPLVMVGGAVTLGAASLVPVLDGLPALLRLPLDAILLCARWFGALPAASVTAGVAGGAALTIVLAAALARDSRLRRAGAAAAVALVAMAGGQAAARRPPDCGGPGVHAVDVGQGTAVLLREGGHAVLVDAGPADGGVAGKLRALGVERLDAIFVSHPHVDHALGAVDVLEKMGVERVVGPVTLGWGGGASVVRAARTAGVPVTTAAAGDRFEWGPIGVDVLWPEPGPEPPFSEDLVDPYSLVLVAEVGGTEVLLPGDIRAEQQAELARVITGVPLMVAVHHGSKNLDPGFVDAVAPRLTLVTAGTPNPYGLPAPEAIAAYSRHGRVFRTDQDGRVSVCLRPSGAEVVTER